MSTRTLIEERRQKKRRQNTIMVLLMGGGVALVIAAIVIAFINNSRVNIAQRNINIPEFIKLIQEDSYQEAVRSIKEYNILPAICGRVCQQENQCEGKCIMGKRFEPVAIGHLERFLADWERKNQLKEFLLYTGF